ncbi:MAG: stage III sporulation protein AB [Oscillospiraceae bacterium]
MIRLTGIVMLASAGVLLGRGRAKQLWEKAELFDDMVRATELLRCETEARRPLLRSAQGLGTCFDGRCGSFFRNLCLGLEQLSEVGLEGIWADCAEDCFGDLLSRQELAHFNSLGAVLATGEGLERGFRRCADELTRLGDEAEAIARRDGKMWTSLGLAAGLMLAIVLI